MEMRMSRKIPIHGFTLIELLVVISLIAGLTAILMPALAKARNQSKSIVCLGNMKQMYLAAAIYNEEHDDYFPISYFEQQTETGTISHSWDFSVVEDGGVIEIVAGILWQGETNEKVQQCPSFKGDFNSQFDPYSGYNYNTTFIGHGQNENIPIPAKRTDVKNTAGCVLFGDGQWAEGANKFMRSPLRAEADLTFNGRYAGTQGYRHNDKTNVVWCDGHAESVKELYTSVEPSRFIEDIEKYNNVNKREKIGFLSPDNSAYDLK